MAIFRVSGDRIVEKWGLIDRFGLFEQLGLTLTSGPRMDLIYEITMGAEVDDVGPTPLGHRRIVRVTGGRFTVPKLRGTVLPGGGDWLVERRDGTRVLDVRITLKTDDGHLIYAHYPVSFMRRPR